MTHYHDALIVIVQAYFAFGPHHKHPTTSPALSSVSKAPSILEERDELIR